MEKLILSPWFLIALGVTMGVGLLILGVTLFLFRFLRKKIAQEIMGEPAPGGPDDPHARVVNCPWPCQAHASLVAGLQAQGIELGEVECRQKTLREETLPEKYLRIKDLDMCKAEHVICRADRKAAETELFKRVGSLERGKNHA